MVLVTGATGAIGPRVVAALLEAGYRIRALSLDSPPPGQWPEGVDTQIGDITDPGAVRATMAGVESVIHLAALCCILSIRPLPYAKSTNESTWMEQRM